MSFATPETAARGADRYRIVLYSVLGALVVLAWLSLWLLDDTAFGALLHAHGGHASMHRGGAAGVLFVAGWVVMVIAMMMPATFPLVESFRRLVRRRQDASRQLAALLGAYLAVWTGFGIAVLGIRSGVRSLELGIAGSHAAGGLFLLAGMFQFSALKYRCLDRCRAPLAFVLSRWRGGKGVADALRIGGEHGLYCVGCCWALMLLMFAVSIANLLWMLVLGLLMAAEKTLPAGRRLGRPIGVVLVASGSALLSGP